MRSIGVFAKYWEPGKVKTRLAKDIGTTGAAQIYYHFLATTLARLAGHAHQLDLVYSPQKKIADFEELRSSLKSIPGNDIGNTVAGKIASKRENEVVKPRSQSWTLVPQSEGDLGERLANYFEQKFRNGAEKIVVVGSDCPQIPQTTIIQAFDKLADHDLVFGPAEDGGYYLVGAKKACSEIFFEIDWSTDRVLSQSLAIAEQSGLKTALLETEFDVDDLPTLTRLLDQIQTCDCGLLGELLTTTTKILAAANN